jgi:CheY-like chemotaxis protein
MIRLDRLRHIVVIEDNPADLELIRRAFAQVNFEHLLIVERDGEEALEYLKRLEAGEPLPAAVLLDLRLPKVDGLEVLRHFKQHPLACRAPVIVFSASTAEEDVRRAYENGANSYIVKPDEAERFLEVATRISKYWHGVNVSPA